MSAMSSQISSLMIVSSTVYSDADQRKRKHQSSASLAFVQGIHRGRVNSPHKGPVTRKMFPFDDVIMLALVGFSHILKGYFADTREIMSVNQCQSLWVDTSPEDSKHCWVIVTCPYFMGYTIKANPLKSHYRTTVLKIRTICHARDLWKLSRFCKQLHLVCLPNLCNLPALLSGF